MKIIYLLYALLSLTLAIEVFVSPTGDDSTGDGSSAKPFATIQKAQSYIQALRPQNTETNYVTIRQGTYRISSPLSFSSVDSNVTYRGYAGERPVISGAVPATNWKPIDTATASAFNLSRDIWVSDNLNVSMLHSIYVNGQRRFTARHPNTGYLKWLNDFMGSNPITTGYEIEGRVGFYYREGDIDPNWHNIQDILMIVYQSWTDAHKFIGTIDPVLHQVNFTYPVDFVLSYFGPSCGKRYILENVFEKLDMPGEFYYDRGNSRLYYYPFPFEDLTDGSTMVEAPIAETLISISGNATDLVQNLRFENIAFWHSDWHFEEKNVNLDSQSAVFSQMTSTILLKNTRNCTFSDIEVAHTGNYGVHLSINSQGSVIEGSHLYDLGAGGVYIGTSNAADSISDHTIQNNFFHDGGQIWQAGIGVMIQQSSYNTIQNNEIGNFYYTGISCGWSWGFSPSTAHDNVIQNNYIHNIGRGVLSDMGGIYTLGLSNRTLIFQNKIEQVSTYSPLLGFGLYPDEGSSYMTIEKNIVLEVQADSYGQHYGTLNDVQYNILISEAGAIGLGQNMTGPIVSNSFYFHNNLVILSGIHSYMRLCTLPPSEVLHWQSDYNFFYVTNNCYQGNVFPGNRNISDWRLYSGQDVNSIVGDPLFVNEQEALAGLNFQVSSQSSLSSFQFPNMSAIGLTTFPSSIRNQYTYSKCKETPSASRIWEDFESYAVGETIFRAAYAPGATPNFMGISTDRSSTYGVKSFEFYDSQMGNSWEPHAYWSDLKFTQGLVHVECDYFLQPGAAPGLFLRQYTDLGTYLEGPGLQVSITGNLGSMGTPLVQLNYNQWIRIKIDVTVGTFNTQSFNLTVTFLENSTSVSFFNLPYDNAGFCALSWVGFVSMASTPSAYYIDNFKVYAHAPAISVPENVIVNAGSTIQVPVNVEKVSYWDTYTQLCRLTLQLENGAQVLEYHPSSGSQYAITVPAFTKPGNYTFVVKAREMFGTETTSNAVMVTVNPAPISATSTTSADETMSSAWTFFPQYFLLLAILFIIIN